MVDVDHGLQDRDSPERVYDSDTNEWIHRRLIADEADLDQRVLSSAESFDRHDPFFGSHFHDRHSRFSPQKFVVEVPRSKQCASPPASTRGRSKNKNGFMEGSEKGSSSRSESGTVTSSLSQAVTNETASTVVTSSTDPSSILPSQGASSKNDDDNRHSQLQQSQARSAPRPRRSHSSREDQASLDPRLRSNPSVPAENLLIPSSNASASSILGQDMSIDQAAELMMRQAPPWHCWHDKCEKDPKKRLKIFNILSEFK
nr:hypothetical protein CFP56_41350 [Quercus suber]